MSLFKGVINFAANAYRNSLRKSLAEYGLKYEDILVENDEVLKALSRLDPQALKEREMRIKRAFDLSAKKKVIPVELQVGDPLSFYLKPHLDEIEAERKEREILN
mmetsp:Transcript_24804/g.22526  ORF Transcript_24804/g.22526 Transcript_24804/m.22526 type:complete len:105 (-) Transcript_24804:51-365(-)